MKKLKHILLLPLLALSSFLLAQDITEVTKKIEQQKYTDATAQMAKILEATPTAETYFYSGYTAIRTQDLKAAKTFFEKGIALDEKRHPLNKAGLGMVAHLEGKTSEADKIFEEVLKESRSKDPLILWRIGEAYTGYNNVNGDLEKSLYPHRDATKAILYLEKALKKDKKNAGIWLSLGDARDLNEPRNGGPALTAYEYALEYEGDKSVVNTRIGNIYYRGRSHNIASDFYKAAIKADSLYTPVYLQLADLNFKTNKYKEAAKYLNTYTKLVEKPSTDLLYNSAKYDFLAREYNRAINKIENNDAQINDPVKYRILGRSYFNLKNYAKTIENVQSLMTYAPEKAEGIEYKILGRSYQNGGVGVANDSLAIVYLAKAAKTDTTENIYSEIAEMSYQRKNYTNTIRFVEAGEKKFKKSSVKDKFWLAMAAYRLGRNDSTMYLKADSAFAAVQETNPDHLATVLYRAKANYYGHANPDTAYMTSIPFYERFVELATTKKQEKNFKYDMKIALKYLYSYYIDEDKEPEKAMLFAEKGAELYPDDTDFKQMLNPQTMAEVANNTTNTR
ncbi:MAG: hypothetical protein R2822_31140 [Spirosomataceae bacterium]